MVQFVENHVTQMHFFKQLIFNSTIIQYNQHAPLPRNPYVAQMGTLNKLFTILWDVS